MQVQMNYFTDGYFNREIDKRLIARNKDQQKLHTPSGKLSASHLGNPLQWNMLKIIGVPARDMEPYTLRKFLRGIQAEQQVVKWYEELGHVREKQKPIEYKGAVGYIDIMVDMSLCDTLDLKVVPHEVKSAKNSQWKWIKMRGPSKSHMLQATMYALAVESDIYVIDYVSGEDYRIEQFFCKTEDTAPEVEQIIEEFNAQKIKHKVPVFAPKESWQENDEYNNYPEWSSLTEDQIRDKLIMEYPEAYKRLQL